MGRLLQRLTRDPRHYQIAILSALLVYGVLRLHFDVRPLNVVVLLGTALLTQIVASRWRGIPVDLRSPWISSLSLCLLLRTSNPAWAALAAMLSIGSKFVFRHRGKHIFNPTNFGIVAVLLLTDRAWVSPAQWGNGANFAFLMACLGGLVVTRAARADVTLAFLASYAAILFGRALWLNQRMAIPIHQLEGGGLLLFAFFMISDPKTTPDSRAGRLLFAALVAAGAAFVPFVLYRTNGLLWSLVVFSPVVPLLDRLLPGARYQWPRAAIAESRMTEPSLRSLRPLAQLGGDR